MNEGLTPSGQERLAQLVGSIYRAGMEPALWQDVLNDALGHFESRVAMLWTHDFSTNSIYLPNDRLSCMVGLDSAGVRAFQSHHYATNVWVPRSAHLEEGGTVLSSQLYPEERLPGTEFHADWLRPNDLHHAIGSSVIKGASRQVKLSFVRPRAAGPFREAERRRLAFLLPHVKNAFTLHEKLGRLQALADSLCDALDSLPMGVALLTQEGRVLHVNTQARAVTDRTRALNLAGPLSCAIGSQTAVLRKLVRDAAGSAKGVRLHSGGAMRLQGQGGELNVTVTPLHAARIDGLRDAAAVMFLAAPGDVAPEMKDVWRALHGLTPAEAAVASLFLQGFSAEEIAQRRMSSANTIRTQLKAIYAKVGARRQADLARRLAESLVFPRA